MLKSKIWILVIGLLFSVLFTTDASAVTILDVTSWLGNSTIGWLRLGTVVTTGTTYAYDYTYTLAFAKDATHTKYYYEGGSEYASAFKVLNPYKVTVYGLTATTGWTFDNSSPDYFKWTAPYANRMTVGNSPAIFAVSSDDPPSQKNASAWDGGTAAEGITYGPGIPEPGTMMLLGMGILGLFGLRKRA